MQVVWMESARSARVAAIDYIAQDSPIAVLS